MKYLLRLACLLAALSAIPFASAQAVVSVTGSAQGQMLGYRYGQSYTLVFTVTADAFPTTSGNFTSSENTWKEMTGGPQLFTAVTGTGVTGALTQPAAPATYMSIYSIQYLYLYAWSNGSATGLKSFDGTTDIKVAARIATGASSGLFDDFPSETQPSDYLAEHTGPFTITGNSSYFTIASVDDSQNINFTITDLTITAPTPVPEPATYAALAGLGALGLALYRRRARHA